MIILGLYTVVIILLTYGISIANDTLILKSIMNANYIGNIIPFCRFNLSLNEGLVGGITILQNKHMNYLLSLVLIGIILLVLFMYLVKIVLVNNTKTLKIGITLILAGGIGNFIQRYYLMAVVDYIQCGMNYAQTIVFNLCDLAIVVGILLLLIDRLTKMCQRKNVIRYNPRCNTTTTKSR